MNPVTAQGQGLHPSGRLRGSRAGGQGRRGAGGEAAPLCHGALWSQRPPGTGSKLTGRCWEDANQVEQLQEGLAWGDGEHTNAGGPAQNHSSLLGTHPHVPLPGQAGGSAMTKAAAKPSREGDKHAKSIQSSLSFTAPCQPTGARRVPQIQGTHRRCSQALLTLPLTPAAEAEARAGWQG